MPNPLPELDAMPLHTGTIPGNLRNGKLFPLRGDDRKTYALLCDTWRDNSIIYDFENEIILRSIPLDFNASPNQDMALVRNKYLVGVGSGSIECHDIIQNQPVPLTAPHVGRLTELSTLVTTPAGALYVIGGKNPRTNCTCNAVDYFDFRSRSGAMRWRLLRPLQRARWNAAGICIGQKIVVVGGQEQNRQKFIDTDSTEVLIEGNWTHGPTLKTARRGPSVVAVGSTVLVFGGTKGDEFVQTVEAWDTGNTDCFVELGRLTSSARIMNALAVGNIVYVFFAGAGRVEIKKLEFHQNQFVPGGMKVAPAASPQPFAPEFETVARPSAPIAEELAQPVSNVFALEPPARPIFPSSSTLHERSRALADYIQTVKKIEESYSEAVEAAIERRINAGKKQIQALQSQIDLDIESMQNNAKAWVADNHRLVQSAKAEMNQQQEFLQQHRNFVARDLSRADEDDYDDQIPSQLRCPITLQIMTDPVVAADGNTYERSALEAWFDNSKGKQLLSPMTGAKLDSEQVFPVHTLKSLCQQFVTKNKSGSLPGGLP